jgi:hypothetical protein
MRLLLAFLFVFTGSSVSQASASIGPDLLREFDAVYERVSQLEPDGLVGGYMNSKSFGDYEVIWRLAESSDGDDVIRIYHERTGNAEKSFVISYYRNNYLVEGRRVVRRFIGPPVTGWRNDTVDVESGEYYGRQGIGRPMLEPRDLEIMKEWGVNLPND